jgi:hypothetical protein
LQWLREAVADRFEVQQKQRNKKDDEEMHALVDGFRDTDSC